MERRRIIVVGYPKSGNTWVTRLTADLIDAPVRGFWLEPDNRDVAVEGAGRRTPIDVYKGHQVHSVIARTFAPRDMIYVVRDVRDAAVSAAHYFSFRERCLRGRVAYAVRRLRERMSRRLDMEFRLTRMLSALADGDGAICPWCSRPWDEHVRGYLDAGVFIIRYEDVLVNPEIECRRLLRHIGVERTTQQIRAAIRRQSFAVAKQRFIAAGDTARATFLRGGRTGDWKAALTENQQVFCWSRFGPTLARLGYDTQGVAESLHVGIAGHRRHR